jgi:lysozyme family protein
MAWDYDSTKTGYENMWNSAEILDSAHYDLEMIADRILASEERYKAVEADTGVPWFWIGAIHSRESSCDFTTHLHNGDPLTARTTHHPPGRPTEGDPPFTWEESAMDALNYQDLIGIDPWDCAQMLLQAELYNGTGYVSHETNSPYLWAGTTHQEPGKYVADGEWDPNAWDQQQGTCAIWKKLCERREDIAEAFETEPMDEDEVPPTAEEAVRDYRLFKVRLLKKLSIDKDGRLSRGLKAEILKNRR